jgi:hypothetical protein
MIRDILNYIIKSFTHEDVSICLALLSIYIVYKGYKIIERYNELLINCSSYRRYLYESEFIINNKLNENTEANEE